MKADRNSTGAARAASPLSNRSAQRLRMVDVENEVNDLARCLKQIRTVAYAGWNSEALDENDHVALHEAVEDIAIQMEQRFIRLQDGLRGAQAEVSHE